MLQTVKHLFGKIPEAAAHVSLCVSDVMLQNFCMLHVVLGRLVHCLALL